MDQGTERALLDEIGHLLARGTTAMAPEPARVPVAEVVGADRMRAEREVLFRRYPMVVTPSAAVPRPGDFCTEDVAGLPLLVVRGTDGAVRVFLNVCRHRGNRLCDEPAGNRRVFSCAYHAWTFTTEGACRSMVDADGFAGLDRSDFGLVEYPSEERHGLVWFRPEGGAELDVAGHLGAAFDAELAGYAPHTRHLFRVEHIVRPFNWKLGINTFQELFHLAFLHKQSLGKAFISNVSTFHSFAPHQRITVIRSTFPEMLTRPAAEQSLLPHVAIVNVLFPNTALIWQLDHVELWRFSPRPGDDGACDVGIWLLTDAEPEGEKAHRHWERNWDVVTRTVFDEDFATMAQVQRNAATGELAEFVYGRNEVGLQDYHRRVGEALATHGVGE